MRVFLGLFPIAALFGFLQPAAADVYPIILKGTVVMEDGSPPPFTAGIERICTDLIGSAPGPTTNKKGEYIWRMEVDPLAVRACYLHATHTGYTSTRIDISGLDTTQSTIFLPKLVMSVPGADPSVISVTENGVPAASKTAFMAGVKALGKGDYPGAAQQFEAAANASPKFAQGWHALGAVDDQLDKLAEARAAFEHAIEADPKMLTAYAMLTRVCIKSQDWQGAAKAADALIKADKKQVYVEAYIHQAVARYELKDLDGAKTSIDEAIRLDPNHKKPRAEYVLGRILEAKGDVSGAREHMTKYLELDPTAIDVQRVKAHLENVGKPEAAVVDPQLEIL